MLSYLRRHAIAFALLFGFLAALRGDDNRDFFSKPETPADYWRRVQFEVEVGKFDFAAEYVKGMLAALAKLKPEEASAELIKIEEKEGMSTFLRLRNVPEQLDRLKEREAMFLKDEKQRDKVLLEVRTHRTAMRTDVNKLIDLVGEALQKEREKFKDAKLIQKLINNLAASPEERAYAVNQLQKSRADAVPYLIQALQDTHGKVAHEKIYSAMLKLDHIAPAMVAALHVKDNDIRRDVLKFIKDSDLVGAIPHLWYLTSAPKYPETVRRQAAQTIAALKRVEVDVLPPAKIALTKLAEGFYHHPRRIVDATTTVVKNYDDKDKKTDEKITVWRFDETKSKLEEVTLTHSQAEEYFGLRFARFALDLDPAYKPAQVVFLSLALEKAYGSDIHLPLKAPKLTELMRTVSPDLLAEVLDRALRERRLPVILGIVQALGDLGDARAVRTSFRGAPVLAKALTYPDRRVQMTAAGAIVHMPVRPAPATAARVVDVFRRILLADPKSKVLVAFTAEKQAELIRRIVAQSGFEPVVVKTRVEALKRLKAAADIDAIVMDHAFPSAREFAFVLAEMRVDMDAGLLPLILIAPPERESRLRRFSARYPHTWVEAVDFDQLDNLKVEAQIITDITSQMAQVRDKLLIIKVLPEAVAALDAQWLAIRNAMRDLKTEKDAIAKLVQDLNKTKGPLKDDKVERDLLDRLVKRLDDLAAEKEKNAKNIDRLSDLKAKVRRYIREAMGRPLSAAEWTVFKEDSLDGLGKMARGQLAGYNIRPAEDAIYAMFRSTQPAFVKESIPIVGRLPGAEPQRELAVFVLDPTRDKLREVAAAELAGHIQRNGLLLQTAMVKRIKALFAVAPGGKLKEQLALVIGSMRPTTVLTGKRLKEYAPAPAAPAPAPAAPAAAKKADKEE